MSDTCVCVVDGEGIFCWLSREIVLLRLHSFVFFRVKDLPPFGAEEYSLGIKLANRISSDMNTVQLLLLKWKKRKILM